MEDEYSESEMARSGSVVCFSKNTISGLLKCFLSCLLLVALIYLLLIFLSLVTSIEIITLFKTLGFISLIIIFTGPLGFYGCCRQSYFALFTYLLVGSYHLYALVIYIWFNLNWKAFTFEQAAGGGQSGKYSATQQNNDLILHQTTTGAYTVLIALTLLMCGARIVSITNQIEPAKVIVVDNNPSE